MRVDQTRVKSKKIIGEFLSKPQETQVVARTTDSFVHVDKDTNALVDAKMIQGLVGGLVKTGGDLVQEYGTDSEAQGKQDALTGGEHQAPKGFFTSSAKYSKGYHGAKDSAQAIRMKGEYLEALEQNDYFMDSDNPEGNRDALYKGLYGKYFEGYLTANGRDGMMTDRGLSVLEEAKLIGDNKFMSRHQEKVKQDFVDDAYTNISDDLEHIETPHDLSVGIDIEYENYTAENGQIITKTEYQGMIIDKLSSRAIEMIRNGNEDGADDLVEMIAGLEDEKGSLYGRILDTDAKTGKVTHLFKDRIDALRIEALSEKAKIAKVKKEQKEELEESNLLDVTLSLSEMRDLPTAGERHVKLMAIRDTFRNALKRGEISDVKAKTYMTLLDGLSSEQGFRENSDTPTLMEATKYAQRSGADLNGLLTRFGDQLSGKDILMLNTKIHTWQDKYKAVGKDAVKNTEALIKKHTKRITDLCTQGGTYIDKKFSEYTDIKVRELRDSADVIISNFMKEHDRLPRTLEIREILREEEARLNEEYNEDKRVKEKLKIGGTNGTKDNKDRGATSKQSGGGLNFSF